MKRMKVVALALLAALVAVGCSLPTREDINKAKNERDGAERPLNESTPTSDE